MKITIYPAQNERTRERETERELEKEKEKDKERKKKKERERERKREKERARPLDHSPRKATTARTTIGDMAERQQSQKPKTMVTGEELR
jgi:hypothetical protein